VDLLLVGCVLSKVMSDEHFGVGIAIFTTIYLKKRYSFADAKFPVIFCRIFKFYERHTGFVVVLMESPFWNEYWSLTPAISKIIILV